MDMTPQATPMYAAGVTGNRTGNVYTVIGWVPYHDNAPDIGLAPVIVPIDGGALAQKYLPDNGIARLFPSVEEARAVASAAKPRQNA
jgi:hypothetical protein